jgi:hypothetical protein
VTIKTNANYAHKNRKKAGRQLFRDFMKSLLQCDVEKNLLAMELQSKPYNFIYLFLDFLWQDPFCRRNYKIIKIQTILAHGNFSIE